MLLVLSVVFFFENEPVIYRAVLTTYTGSTKFSPKCFWCHSFVVVLFLNKPGIMKRGQNRLVIVAPYTKSHLPLQGKDTKLFHRLIPKRVKQAKNQL